MTTEGACRRTVTMVFDGAGERGRRELALAAWDERKQTERQGPGGLRPVSCS